ncbi:MAG: protein kinase [Acidobacteria bacterium]|nr:protein kinase [Acidobacteriota bacterium]
MATPDDETVDGRSGEEATRGGDDTILSGADAAQGGDHTTQMGGDITHTSGTPTMRPRSVAHMQAGDEFGTRYRILKQLGIGGMGVVYQAWDKTLNVVVALKVIRPDVAGDPVAAADIERRFKRELLLARQVTHKNVVRIHDLGDVDGTKYITMSFVEGDDLSTMLKRDGGCRSLGRCRWRARMTVQDLRFMAAPCVRPWPRV